MADRGNPFSVAKGLSVNFKAEKIEFLNEIERFFQLYIQSQKKKFTPVMMAGDLMKALFEENLIKTRDNLSKCE